MDRTLSPNKRTNKRRTTRNRNAWKRFSPDGQTCRCCPHPRKDHITSSGQPHFFAPMTPEEQEQRTIKVYNHFRPDGTPVPVRRIMVAQQAELITAFCKACANEKNTDQVLCYQRTLATGELIGMGLQGGKE